MKLNNCYYLKGTYNVEVGESGSSTGITELDDISDFPSVLEVVNGEGVFKEDVNNIIMVIQYLSGNKCLYYFDKLIDERKIKCISF